MMKVLKDRDVTLDQLNNKQQTAYSLSGDYRHLVWLVVGREVVIE